MLELSRDHQQFATTRGLRKENESNFAPGSSSRFAAAVRSGRVTAESLAEQGLDLAVVGNRRIAALIDPRARLRGRSARRVPTEE